MGIKEWFLSLAPEKRKKRNEKELSNSNVAKFIYDGTVYCADLSSINLRGNRVVYIELPQDGTLFQGEVSTVIMDVGYSFHTLWKMGTDSSNRVLANEPDRVVMAYAGDEEDQSNRNKYTEARRIMGSHRRDQYGAEDSWHSLNDYNRED